MKGRKRAGFELSGGRLCLDFANTVYHRPTPSADDRLPGYRALVTWAGQAGLLGAARARTRTGQAGRKPALERAVMRRAHLLREAIYRVFSAVAARRPPAAGDLDRLSATVTGMLAGGRLVAQGGTFIWRWPTDPGLQEVLGPVARSVVELLTSTDLARLRRCAAADCGWLFLDTTRNQTRRWCDMATCGNRAKARRFYARRVRGVGAGRAGGRSARGRPGESRTRPGARARPRP